MSGVREFGKPFEGARVTAKVFQHGGSQAVRLPKAFRFEGTEVTVRRDGDAVILEPIKKKRPPTREEMEAFWAEVDSLGGADFPDREQPPEQKREFW
ncbi:MAG TPA: AbrB/MazE/SpoVT family DNA-binding domain-containing protein [Caulobacteraceae bacterium]|jgi:antitoxin VapB